MKRMSKIITNISIKNFRCFEHIVLNLDSLIVLIFGANGTGKTSLLEALYYGCYLRSFRTNTSRDLVALGKESFFVKLSVRDKKEDNSVEHAIQIGFADNKRLVKIDNQTAVSYKDLLSYYRVVSLTEDDLKLIQDGPEERRDFLDTALLLYDVSFITKLREYRYILENRNALFQKDSIDKDSYFVWTQKLWEYTSIIQQARKQFLAQLEIEVNKMVYQHIDTNITISFTYQAKKNSDLTFDGFINKNISLDELLQHEMRFKRSLFGAHVDDFIISLEGKRSRAYASRGQQKMIVLLIKIAQIKQLTMKNSPIIFLLDDFMTDFDPQKSALLLPLLIELNCQLIFTSPHANTSLELSLQESRRPYKIISM